MTTTIRYLGVVALWSFLALQPARADGAATKAISVKEVVKMALKVARHTAPGRAAELGKRARLAGLVPQLKLGARRGLQQDQSSTSTLSDDRVNASLGDDLTVEAGLTFQLDRLVFAPEQVRLLAVERWLAADRRKLVEDVVHLFFRRARLVHERDSAASPDADIDADIAELEALLDAYTEGQFSVALANLPRHRKAAAKAAGTKTPNEPPSAAQRQRQSTEPAAPKEPAAPTERAAPTGPAPPTSISASPSQAPESR